MKTTQVSQIRKAEPPQLLSALGAEIKAAVNYALDERWDDLLEVVAAKPVAKLEGPAGIEAFLGVTSQTVRKLREQGMPFLMVGECYRYDLDAVKAWLGSRDTSKAGAR